MTKITKVEVFLVDLKPATKRTDAIQSFVSQETPIVRITDADGVVGTGYSYTIGTGGSSVLALLTIICARTDRRARPRRSKGSGATCSSAPMPPPWARITSIALAAIDTALWDLRCRRADCRCTGMAGGAKTRCRSTRPRAAGCISSRPRWSTTRSRQGEGFSAAPRSRSAARMSPRMWRACRRARCGRPRLGDHDRRQSGLYARRGDPAGAAL